MSARFRFTLFTLAAAVGLLGWGAFVTSIDAGLAVPDWPSSFDSYDPFNPWPEWWRVTPILAEHGHRLAGAVVGLLTLILFLWTWRSERRRWVRGLSLLALVLVSLQGLLGGLRVVWVSLDLAVVHACVAQLFFALLASLALFTSSWWGANDRPASLRNAGLLASGVLYLQIILGAVLRHPGTGIDPVLAGLHMTWAFVALGAVLFHVRSLHAEGLSRMGRSIGVLVFLQVALGFLAYFVLLDERGVLQPSNLQVVVNSSHLVIGAALFATNVVGMLALGLAQRRHLTPSPQVT